MLYKKKRGPLNHGMRMERLVGELMHLIFSIYTGKKVEVGTFIKHWDNPNDGVATLDDFKSILGITDNGT